MSARKACRISEREKEVNKFDSRSESSANEGNKSRRLGSLFSQSSTCKPSLAIASSIGTSLAIVPYYGLLQVKPSQRKPHFSSIVEWSGAHLEVGSLLTELRPSQEIRDTLAYEDRND